MYYKSNSTNYFLLKTFFFSYNDIKDLRTLSIFSYTFLLKANICMEYLMSKKDNILYNKEHLRVILIDIRNKKFASMTQTLPARI